MNTPLQPQTPQKAASNMTLILIAIIMGVATMIVTHLYVQGIKDQVDIKMVTVYRFRKAYESGDKLKMKDLEPIKIPQKFNEEFNFITDGSINNRLNEPLKQNARQSDYLTAEMFLTSGFAHDRNIKPGRQAVAIPIESRNAPGVIAPGMYVDINASFPIPGEKPKVMSVMQAVKIIAVGRVTEDSGSRSRSSSYNSITIEVDPTEALEMLTVSKHVGREGFDITIRNPDNTTPDYIGVNKTVRELVGLAK